MEIAGPRTSESNAHLLVDKDASRAMCDYCNARYTLHAITLYAITLYATHHLRPGVGEQDARRLTTTLQRINAPSFRVSVR